MSYVNNYPKSRGYSEQDKRIYSFQRAYILVGEAKNKQIYAITAVHQCYQIKYNSE